MHSGGCAGTAELYRRTREPVLVQQSTIGALGWLCWCNRVLQKPLGSCAGTAEYNWKSREAVLVQQSTIGLLGRHSTVL